MENASKALIIAGAILLSILIIALGMSVYNSSKSASANADLSATEVSSFNSTFEAYEGVQKGSTVRTLITAILSSNKKNDDRKITINGTSSTTAGVTTWTAGTTFQTPNAVTSNIRYKVEFDYDSKTGLIKNCKISIPN